MHQDHRTNATPKRPEATPFSAGRADGCNAGTPSPMDAQAELSALADRWNFRLLV